MTEKAARVLADYFAATNAHDIAAMSAAFTGEATVHDEGRAHQIDQTEPRASAPVTGGTERGR
jgi:hypothetical protein